MNPSATVALVDRLGSAPMNEDQVRGLWSDLTGWSPDDRPDAWEACEDGVLGTLAPDRSLQMRPGGWVVDLSNTLARTSVAAALIAGTLWPAGLDQLPAFIPPAVLPMLFDIERAKLTRQDRRLLVELRLSMAAEQADRPWTPTALHGRLTDEVRSAVDLGDFEEFLDRVVQVGLADDAGYDEVRLRPGPPAWLRISIV